MTRICYEREHFRLSIEGHAGAGSFGEDLVCAGVSALWMALERKLTADRATVLRYRPVIVCGDGIRRAECCPDEKDEEACREAMETIAAGLRWMAERYPDFVSYEEG